MNVNVDMADAIEHLAEHMQRRGSLRLELDAGTVFALIGTLQLALRHPQWSGPTRDLMERFKSDLAAEFAGADDYIANLLKLGDDPTFDVPR